MNPGADAKNHKAVVALRDMAQITERLVGWAIDHQIGLAMSGQSTVSLTPRHVKSPPEPTGAVDHTNSHKHEKRASLHFRRSKGYSLDGETQRLILWNLLRSNALPLPYALREEWEEALHAARYGELRPLFNAPRIGLGKEGYSKKCLWMKALEHVAFRRGRGEQAGASQTLVASRFKETPATVRGWITELKNFFGPQEVSSRLAAARGYGLYVREARLRGNVANKIRAIESEMGSRRPEEWGNSEQRKVYFDLTAVQVKLEHAASLYSDDVLTENGNQYRSIILKAAEEAAPKKATPKRTTKKAAKADSKAKKAQKKPVRKYQVR
jgi:hypothetical protein